MLQVRSAASRGKADRKVEERRHGVNCERKSHSLYNIVIVLGVIHVICSPSVLCMREDAARFRPSVSKCKVLRCVPSHYAGLRQPDSLKCSKTQ